MLIRLINESLLGRGERGEGVRKEKGDRGSINSHMNLLLPLRRKLSECVMMTHMNSSLSFSKFNVHSHVNLAFFKSLPSNS